MSDEMIEDEVFWKIVEEIVKRNGSITLGELMLLKEAQASIDLDKGDGETHAV